MSASLKLCLPGGVTLSVRLPIFKEGDTQNISYSGGGGLVRAHTTDRSRFFPCQPCPVLQLPSVWEIPRERRAEVGLRPLNLM